MAKRKVLVQWIGHSDLRALATLLPSTKQKQILDGLGGAIAGKDDCGPTKSLLRQRDFDEVRLLSNYPAEWNNWFAKWLGSPVVFVEVELSKPTDYSAIFEIADSELQEIKNRKDWGETELCLHLSPGTPAMAAVWLLLGKTRYPATFYETSRGGD
ncbi:MAG: hypothetical protein KDA84_08890, partial [Planctomycetaceae bacterium]|nr:hypothetical protein [Planctomycetaceae bacterium]